MVLTYCFLTVSGAHRTEKSIGQSRQIRVWMMLASYRPLALENEPRTAKKDPGQPTESSCEGPEESVLGLRSGRVVRAGNSRS